MEKRRYSAEEKAEFAAALQLRTKKAALEIVKLFQTLPKTEEARILGRQLLRSGTSTAANYRAVNRARSPQEQFAKLCITVEEADETLFWLEMLRDAHITTTAQTSNLEKEFKEIVSILAKARKNSQQ